MHFISDFITMCQDNKSLTPIFGKVFGRKFNKFSIAKKAFLDQSLVSYAIDQQTNLQQLFTLYNKVILEIGFGNGDFLYSIANKYPHNLYIGAEVFVNGVYNLLKQLTIESLDNLKIWHNDAKILLNKLPAKSLDSIYILFPDPWPKRKHHKRRLINVELLNILYELLDDNGTIYIASDHADYVGWIMESILLMKKFYIDFNNHIFDDLIITRYANKAQRRDEIISYITLKKYPIYDL